MLTMILAVLLNVNAMEDNMIEIGTRMELHSTILDEDRTILVGLPYGYAESQQSYPLLIVLDGGTPTSLAHAVSTMEMLDGKSLAPQMIVAGIATGNGVRDYFPLPIEGRPESGHADRFLGFIIEELIPHLESEYRVAPCRVLYGGSNAGMFLVNAMLQDPESFSGYIAASPSLGWFPDFFREGLSDFVPSGDTRLYLNWGSDDLQSIVLSATPELAADLESAFADSGSYRYQVLQDGGHVPYISLYSGLEWVFQGWRMADSTLLEGGLTALDEHYAGLSDQYGFEVPVPAGKYMTLGQHLLRGGDFEAAGEVFSAYSISWPGSSRAAFFLGEAHRLLGNTQEAIDCYTRAQELDPDFAPAGARIRSLQE